MEDHSHKLVQFEYTALTWATSSGHASCVRLLLDAGVDKEAETKVRVCHCVTAVLLLKDR